MLNATRAKCCRSGPSGSLASWYREPKHVIIQQMGREVRGMATVHYMAKVKDSRLLELPEEAQELGLKPGEEVSVSVDRFEVAAIKPNEKALAALREIAERH